ncbi:hypothetical protein [Oceanirhabdus seepicola]|uniref:Uncharacterized protein n=1 Tax=Oceanirhabdus seepicola TaxID=2828781 RepID=A0A9J6NX43_9CLOT|nr:hypothetical protein [Oceanirhabdus seepicola]MCM1989079.1 hypothetical protein [Oceanirhabdus seepicola]
MELYLLGGRPCSGKTTLSYYLGQKHKIEVRYLDVFAQKCINESTIDTPNIYRWKDKDLVDVLQKKPDILFNEYLGFYEEMFPMLFDELDSIKEKKVILEGSIFLPKFIDTLKEKYDVNICYLVTDDDFVKEKYIKRDYVQDMLTKPNGEIAVTNLLERDSIFANYIANEIEKYSLPRIHIKSGNDIEKELSALEKILGL